MGKLSLQFRIKMKRTTWVRAIVETNTGEVWADYATGQRVAQRVWLMDRTATRGSGFLRRIQQGDIIPVSAIVQHPMDTGFFRSASGQPIPCGIFIKDVTARVRRPAGGALPPDLRHQPRSGGDLPAGRRP